MTTAWKAREGTLEMALRALKNLALSDAYTAEVHDRWTLLTTQAPRLTFSDVTGNSFLIDMTDNTYPPNTPDTWLSDTFSEVLIEDLSDPEQLSGSWPQLRLVPGRGHTDIQPGSEEAYGSGVRQWLVPVEAAVLVSQDQAEAAQRDALIMAEAYESLVRRNEYLGGLVMLCRADGPVIAGGYGPVGGNMLAIAVQRFELRLMKV